MRLEFKFREKVPPSQRREIVRKVAEIGASEVGPLFPGDNDPELASMYKAVGVPDDQADDLLSQLGADDAVEYAEPTPERKLIR